MAYQRINQPLVTSYEVRKKMWSKNKQKGGLGLDWVELVTQISPFYNDLTAPSGSMKT